MPDYVRSGFVSYRIFDPVLVFFALTLFGNLFWPLYAMRAYDGRTFLADGGTVPLLPVAQVHLSSTDAAHWSTRDHLRPLPLSRPRSHVSLVNLLQVLQPPGILPSALALVPPRTVFVVSPR